MSDPAQPVQKVNFYDAALPRLTGRGMILPMLKYLKFRELMVKFKEQVEKNRLPTERADTFISIMDVVGISGDEKAVAAMLYDILAANPITPMLAWQEPVEPEKEKMTQTDIVYETNTSYEGREVATMVTTLASTFGWTADYILMSLTYYEACIYMQEALLIEHAQKSWQYLLAADVGVEKKGDDLVKSPMPDLPWVKRKAVRQTPATKIPDRYKPGGVVIDYTTDSKGVASGTTEADS